MSKSKYTSLEALIIDNVDILDCPYHFITEKNNWCTKELKRGIDRYCKPVKWNCEFYKENKGKY